MGWADDGRGLSIFAKPASFQRTHVIPHPHLVRGSSIIRGEQISQHLGCRLNPANGHENDLQIHVKPDSMGRVPDEAWIDVMDSGDRMLALLKERPDIKALMFSWYTYWRARSKQVPNRMEMIPQHHCNFDRELRTRDDIRVAGFIGGEVGFHYSFDEVRKLLATAGYDFIYRCRYRTREAVVDFYKRIDVQVVLTRPKPRYQAKAPLKVVNAASFGIPTVAFPQACYQEVQDHYILADGFVGLVDRLKALKDPGLYEAWSSRLANWAEGYHIDRIAGLYRGLY